MCKQFLLFLFALLCCTTTFAFGEDSTSTPIQRIQQHAVGQVVIDSQDSNLDISCYTLSGQKVPYTVWKSRHESGLRYEAGYDLKKGVYLIKIKSGDSVSYLKLVRKSS